MIAVRFNSQDDSCLKLSLASAVIQQRAGINWRQCDDRSMLIIIVTGGIALALTLIRRYCWDDRQLIVRHVSSPGISGVQIICGDCCGTHGFPAKTYMDAFGRCQRCGGNSVILAAHRKGLRPETIDAAPGARAHNRLANAGSTDRLASSDDNDLSQAWLRATSDYRIGAEATAHEGQ